MGCMNDCSFMVYCVTLTACLHCVLSTPQRVLNRSISLSLSQCGSYVARSGQPTAKKNH